MAKVKSDKVIRRVILGKEYNIFSLKFTNGVPSMDLLETVESSTRPKEADIIEKFKDKKVEKVVIFATSTKIGHYGVPIDEFMKIATLEKTETKQLDETEEAETESK